MEWQRILYGVLGLIVLGILIWYAIRKKNPQDFEKKAKKYGLLGRVVGRVDSVSQETFHRYNDDDSYVYYPKEYISILRFLLCCVLGWSL